MQNYMQLVFAYAGTLSLEKGTETGYRSEYAESQTAMYLSTAVRPGIAL